MHVLFMFGLGQLICFCEVLSSFGVKLENKNGLFIPCWNTCGYYILILIANLVYSCILKIKFTDLNFRLILQLFIISIIDSQCNFVGTLGLQYCSITVYAMLMSCSTLTSAIFSFIFLKRKLHCLNWIGIIITIVGLTISLISSIEEKGSTTTILGVLLILIYQILYGLTFVLQELFLSKGIKTCQYYTYLGLFGTFICLIEFCILKEYKNFNLVFETPKAFLSYCCTIVPVLLMYQFSSIVIKLIGATFVNLNTLSSPIYGDSMEHFLLGNSWNNAFFYFGFLIIISGIICYSIKDSKKEDNYPNMINESRNISLASYDQI